MKISTELIQFIVIVSRSTQILRFEDINGVGSRRF